MNRIKDYLIEMLKEGSRTSNMRFIVTFSTVILITSLGFAVVYQTITSTLDPYLIGGVVGIVITVVTGKVKQKGLEKYDRSAED